MEIVVSGCCGSQTSLKFSETLCTTGNSGQQLQPANPGSGTAPVHANQAHFTVVPSVSCYRSKLKLPGVVGHATGNLQQPQQPQQQQKKQQQQQQCSRFNNRKHKHNSSKKGFTHRLQCPNTAPDVTGQQDLR
ncbi:hypothetical protein JCM33374_g5249 [Metschnikowia sp. JCM 33374]|nr:hypothetical protein JCM33374_g5249 [Metschnikowia sp. JCM 33374]